MNEIRLLIADKETDVRTAIKTYASMEGFICDEAADGISAIKLFRRNEYSMILLDAGLPDLDSWSSYAGRSARYPIRPSSCYPGRTRRKKSFRIFPPVSTILWSSPFLTASLSRARMFF